MTSDGGPKTEAAAGGNDVEGDVDRDAQGDVDRDVGHGQAPLIHSTIYLVYLAK